MTEITREQVRKIAHISHIAVEEHKLDELIQRLQEVLNYAERVKEIAATMEHYEEIRQCNVLRADTAYSTDTAPLLAQAPHREEQYFTVPKVLSNR